MGLRKTVFSIEEYYHIYSRGVDRRIIFLDNSDRERFIRLLYICNGSLPVVYRLVQGLSLDKIEVGDKLVALGAYCLMPNHFHLLIREITEGGTVKFMRKVLTAYSSYFNKKYERFGALFSGKFKSQHLDSDEYLKYIFAYIHLNPLKIFDPKWKEKTVNTKDAQNFLNNYFFSSYTDYLTKEGREEEFVLNKLAFPQYFDHQQDWVKSVQEWINFDPDNLPRKVLGKPGDNSESSGGSYT